MIELSEWAPLTEKLLRARAPDEPAAVQLRRANGLVPYARGKSAMVFYFYAARSARQALLRAFADEVAEPGARGQGPLWFRTAVGGDDVREGLERLYEEFVARFGAPPVLHASDDDDAAERDASSGRVVAGEAPELDGG